ncbi:MAG: DUF4242 domain-containing protein [Pseudomonadales bacterium]|nr:DUF4242 domain-containing protein [Pseudomonadales bacterium]
MAEIFLLREFSPPIGLVDVQKMADDTFGCMPLYDMSWQQSYLSNDGRKMLCHFKAPDAEAVRRVLRLNSDSGEIIWTGSIHDAGIQGPINTVVERNFSEPVSIEKLQGIENQGAWCLEMHQVTFVSTFFSMDKKHMFCFYLAPDAESVRIAQRKANMPFDTIWSCQHLQPERQ